jgi:hypothetical protein
MSNTRREENSTSKQILDTLLDAFEKRGDVKKEGKGWRVRCPNPTHSDNDPSAYLYPDGGVTCFSQCARSWSPWQAAELLGISLPRDKLGLSLNEYAEAKGLSKEFLQSQGLRDGVCGSARTRS